MDGYLVIISAPSGAGKTTIANYLLKMDLNLEFSVSATTRKPRGNEVDGKEYYFISVGEFREKIRNNEFTEWEEVYRDQFYGTLKSEIERIWSGNKNVLFDVDAKGGISLKNIFGPRAVSIFIMPPSVSELEKRLKGRATDHPSKISIRLEKAVNEMSFAGRFDHVVINDDLKKTKEEVYGIVRRFIRSCY